jgi:hypothetical protein
MGSTQPDGSYRFIDFNVQEQISGIQQGIDATFGTNFYQGDEIARAKEIKKENKKIEKANRAYIAKQKADAAMNRSASKRKEYRGNQVNVLRGADDAAVNTYKVNEPLG